MPKNTRPILYYNPIKYDYATAVAWVQQFSVNHISIANTGQECPAYRDRRGFLTPL
ncbi:MAG: hypothetical protein HZA08_07265 [Nitrospirae bacterium]|nr:hypothetical protein [Nitrospirota bacterium]